MTQRGGCSMSGLQKGGFWLCIPGRKDQKVQKKMIYLPSGTCHSKSLCVCAPTRELSLDAEFIPGLRCSLSFWAFCQSLLHTQTQLCSSADPPSVHFCFRHFSIFISAQRNQICTLSITEEPLIATDLFVYVSKKLYL